nr:hypothetical protein GCM10025699_20240 [Microbacterium flavescens]
MPHHDLLRSARPAAPRSALAERMTFGFVLRDLVRRRAGVVVHLSSGRALTGTIDRAGADHFDLALHEPGTPRRADAIAGHRIVPFAAVAWVRVEGAPRLCDPGRPGGTGRAGAKACGRPPPRRAGRQSGWRTEPVPHSSGKLAFCACCHSAVRRASSAWSSR